MKTLEHRVQERQHSRLAADLETATSAIFRRCPTLCGFAVRADPSALVVVEVSVFPLSGLGAPEEVRSEIAATLIPLLDEFPEAGALLRGRSFARAFH